MGLNLKEVFYNLQIINERFFYLSAIDRRCGPVINNSVTNTSRSLVTTIPAPSGVQTFGVVRYSITKSKGASCYWTVNTHARGHGIPSHQLICFCHKQTATLFSINRRLLFYYFHFKGKS